MRGQSLNSTGRKSRSIEMFATFLAANGGEESARLGTLTSSAEAFRARTSATPEDAPASREPDPGSGLHSPASFAFFDQSLSSWRTSQLSLFEGLGEFSATWPRSGTMRNGTAYPLSPLVRLTYDGESSLLPTPTSHCAKGQKTPYAQGGIGLVAAVQSLYPTPRATDGTKGGRVTPRKAKNGVTLTEAVSMKMFPTPSAADSKGHTCYSRGETNPSLAGVVKKLHPSPRADSRDNAGGSNSRRTAKANGTYFGRTLNPGFVGWMMGFPPGFTQLEE